MARNYDLWRSRTLAYYEGVDQAFRDVKQLLTDCQLPVVKVAKFAANNRHSMKDPEDSRAFIAISQAMQSGLTDIAIAEHILTKEGHDTVWGLQDDWQWHVDSFIESFPHIRSEQQAKRIGQQDMAYGIMTEFKNLKNYVVKPYQKRGWAISKPEAEIKSKYACVTNSAIDLTYGLARKLTALYHKTGRIEDAIEYYEFWLRTYQQRVISDYPFRYPKKSQPKYKATLGNSLKAALP